MGKFDDFASAIIGDVSGGYSPRSSKHSDLQMELLLQDLLAVCPLLRERALSGDIVAKVSHKQQVGSDDWKVDLAIGVAPFGVDPPTTGIVRLAPVTIQIAVEAKSIWTEHGKAKRNRQRDFNAFASHASRYNNDTVRAALLVVNAADYFVSPLNLNRPKGPVTIHGAGPNSGASVAGETISLFRSVPLRQTKASTVGLDALIVIVVRHTNFVVHPSPETLGYPDQKSAFVTSKPAPSVGDPLHYETLLRRVCDAYAANFP